MTAILQRQTWSAALVRRANRAVANAFCPTGEGGGVDPTCPSGKGKGGNNPPTSRKDLTPAERKHYDLLTTGTPAERAAKARHMEARIQEGRRAAGTAKPPATPAGGGFGEVGAGHPMAGLSVKEQRARLAEAREDSSGNFRPLGIDEAGPPPGLDMTEFGRRAGDVLARHAETTSRGLDMPEAYEAVGKPLGLSKHDFLRAVTAAHRTGDVRLSGWGQTTDEVPHPDLVTQISDKLFYYVNPGRSQSRNARPRARPKAKRRRVLDPTRTTTLRNAFARNLKRKWRIVKGRLRRWLVEQDALGLDRPEVIRLPMTDNAFCATGPGGGVDPTCSPPTDGSSVGVEVSGSKVNLKLAGGVGELEMHDVGFEFQVREVKVTEAERGKGLGKQLYKAAIAYARAQGKGLRSDAATSISADRVWQSLRKEGLPVERAETELDQGLGKFYAVKDFPLPSGGSLKIRSGEPVWRLKANSFCPTGEGGGIDPTCSPSGASPASASLPRRTYEKVKAVTAKVKDKLVGRYGAKTATAIVVAAQATSWGAFGAGAAFGVPVWVPSAAAALPYVALAELKLQLDRRKAARAQKRNRFVEWTENEVTLTEDEIRAAAVELVADLIRELRDETTNAFCATGEGGGIDNTCPPSKGGGEDVGTEPKDRPDREIHHLGVERVAKDTADAWKYKGEVKVLDQDGPEFERGGVKWREGGRCTLATGEVTIHSGTAGENVESVRRLVAHELMHGSFEHVYKQYDDDRRRIMQREEENVRRYDAANPGVDLGTRARALDEMGVIRASGALKPGYENEFPTYARFHRFREEVPNEQYIKDDGVSEYSKAYWRDYEAGKTTFHIAVHETLAEIAGHHEATGEIVGSKLYRDYYKATRDEYKVLTGSKKTRSKAGSTRNGSLYADHELYLDRDLKPTDPGKAVYLRWWAADGSSGWASRSPETMTTNAPPKGFQFVSTPEKLAEFRRWLRAEFDKELLAKPDADEWELFVRRGFRQGAGRAWDDARIKERAGSAQTGDFWRGSRQEFLRSAFAQPESREKVQLLASRSFTDLRNVTEDVATRMGRVLADGLTRGANPRDIADELDDALELGVRRSEVIARTEIVRAHAEGQLDAFDRLGVRQLGVEVEWSTAGDDRVCPECEAMEGKTFSVDEAHGMIPAHPQCRCAFLPVVPSGEEG